MPSESDRPSPATSAPPRHRALSNAFHRSLSAILADSRAVAARESGADRAPHLTPAAPPKPSRELPRPVREGRAAPLYRKALALYKAGDYERSRSGFQEFLERFPRHSLSDNARYWIGECWYAQGQYREAGVAFRAVLVDYNDSNKFPDAFFKLGLCHHLRGDETAARTYWRRLVQRYPETRAAALARRRLSRDAAD
jgi:tol-pal system protein YbgF